MSHFTKEQLEEAVRDGVDLTGVDFANHPPGVGVQDIDLDAIVIPEARMSECILEGLDASGGGNYRGINLRGAQMAGVDMTGSDFTGATFDDADLTDCIMTGATFTRASFKRTLMANIVAAPATFIEADLGSADIRGADFTASDMRGASISLAWTSPMTKLKDTIFDDGTVP